MLRRQRCQGPLENRPWHVGVTDDQDLHHGYVQLGFRSMAWPLPDSMITFSNGSVSR